MAALLFAHPASAQESDDETILRGAEVYSQTCSGCHQPGGAGISGQFPPLIDNPRVSDFEYMTDVITNGLQGEIEVGGVMYNSVMPAQATLSDDDVAAVIVYVQGGFVTPGAGEEPEGSGLPLAGTSLPALSGMAAVAAYAVAVAAFALVLGPRISTTIDRLNLSWTDAWMKAFVIFTFFVVFTVFVPSRVLQSQLVSSLARPVQDVIGSGLWVGGLAAGLWALWFAHRDKRI